MKLNSNINNYEVLSSRDLVFLRQCALSEDENIRRNVALNHNIDKKIESILIKDDSLIVRRALATNESLSPKFLYKLALDADEEVMFNAISNKNFSDQYLILLANSDREDVKLVISKKRNLPKLVLDKFSKEANPKLREVAARGNNIFYKPNPDLCYDECEDVRAALASNTNTPLNALLVLSGDTSEKVIEALSWNRSITKEIRHNIALTGNVRACVNISREELYQETCYILFDLNNRWVNSSLASNSCTPLEILRELAKSDDASTKELAEFRLNK